MNSDRASSDSLAYYHHRRITQAAAGNLPPSTNDVAFSDCSGGNRCHQDYHLSRAMAAVRMAAFRTADVVGALDCLGLWQVADDCFRSLGRRHCHHSMQWGFSDHYVVTYHSTE